MNIINTEKVDAIYKRVAEIDNRLMSMEHENKSMDDSMMFNDLVFGKKALFKMIEDLGETIR